MTGAPLAEELLLLAHDDSGRPTVSRDGLDLGLAAAVLAELALADRIAYADGALQVVDPSATGAPVPDAVLDRLRADTAHSPESWLQRLRIRLRDRFLAELIVRGVIREEPGPVGDEQSSGLGFVPVGVENAPPGGDVRNRLAAALAGTELPDEQTAVLATLVAAVGMAPPLPLTGASAAAAGERLTAIAESPGLLGGLPGDVVRPQPARTVAALGLAILPNVVPATG
ncbi:GOLPH3/VPS74 family protein [Melissospora conviva]|uniref:GOLPH3/VPS74 family protein n=1 Tax=Melissospora conviva TaxID=3388432 RepID=UPI003B7CBBEA